MMRALMQRTDTVVPRAALLAVLMATMVACKPAGHGSVRTPVDARPSSQRSPPEAPARSTGDAATIDAQRAYVAKACSDLCEEAPGACECEATLERGDWLFLRMSRTEQAQTTWSWFVIAMVRPGYRFLAERELDESSARGNLTDSYSLCRETTITEQPPLGAGLMNVEVFELISDDELFGGGDEIGSADLVVRFECKQNVSTRNDHFAYECDTYGCNRILADEPGLRAESRRQSTLRRLLHTPTPDGASGQARDVWEPDDDDDKSRLMSNDDYSEDDRADDDQNGRNEEKNEEDDYQ